MYDKEFKTIFDYAAGKVDDIEILLVANGNFSVKVFKQDIDSFEYADTKGIGVRVIKNGHEGYAYTEQFSDEAFFDAVDRAVESSAFLESEEKPLMADYPDCKAKLELFSNTLADVTVEEKISFAKQMEKEAADGDPRVFNVNYSAVGNGSTFVRVANSKGLDKQESYNSGYAYVGVLAEEDEEKRSGSEFGLSRDFSELDASWLASSSVDKAVSLLGGVEVENGNYPVVFNNEMMASFLGVFSSIFSAKSVQEGRSLLKGKIGEKIAGEGVTIVDDAIHADGYSSRHFDSEGFPSQCTVLVENGVLKSFLHNTITARKDGVKSTGNAARSYKGTLGVSTSNFCLQSGSMTETELFSQHDQVIEVVSLQGLHSGANATSGDFSLMAEGYLYESGQRKCSLKPFTISGNILQLFKDVEKIADNFRFSMSAVGTSSVLVKTLSVSG